MWNSSTNLQQLIKDLDSQAEIISNIITNQDPIDFDYVFIDKGEIKTKYSWNDNIRFYTIPLELFTLSIEDVTELYKEVPLQPDYNY